MPKRTDIKKILIIGSGPIIIGQACEFDYSGTQACKSLRSEGYEVILVNSNPATIMTDPEIANRTYIEPLSKNYLEAIIAAERPDALLPTVGGQTGLNLAVELAESGILEKYGVKLIGASLDAIRIAEDRLLFKDVCRKIGLEVPASAVVTEIPEAIRFADQLGYPVVIRPSFTLGGTGGSIAYNHEEFVDAICRALDASPVRQALIEESVIGWKEYELEVMRDCRDNFVVICSIENFDPMGIHTGDSITVAPAQTLTDKEYQRMRDAAAAIIRAVGVETGGSNIQFAIDPETGRMIVIEMNPRVSRSSALASKATGFPIAKIAAKLALGMTLDEIPNDITRKTPCSFEPTIDYVVAKIPKWQFEKFPGSDTTLDHANEIGRRSDGHRPHVSGSPLQGHSRAGAQHGLAPACRSHHRAAARKTSRAGSRPPALAFRSPRSRHEPQGSLRPHEDRSLVHRSSGRNARGRSVESPQPRFEIVRASCCWNRSALVPAMRKSPSSGT